MRLISPKDDNLGELMSTARERVVRCGACSAVGVGGPAGSAGGGLGVDYQGIFPATE